MSGESKEFKKTEYIYYTALMLQGQLKHRRVTVEEFIEVLREVEKEK